MVTDFTKFIDSSNISIGLNLKPKRIGLYLFTGCIILVLFINPGKNVTGLLVSLGACTAFYIGFLIWFKHAGLKISKTKLKYVGFARSQSDNSHLNVTWDKINRFELRSNENSDEIVVYLNRNTKPDKLEKLLLQAADKISLKMKNEIYEKTCVIRGLDQDMKKIKNILDSYLANNNLTT